MSDGTRQLVFLKEVYKDISIPEAVKKETCIQKAVKTLILWGKRSLRKML